MRTQNSHAFTHKILKELLQRILEKAQKCLILPNMQSSATKIFSETMYVWVAPSCLAATEEPVWTRWLTTSTPIVDLLVCHPTPPPNLTKRSGLKWLVRWPESLNRDTAFKQRQLQQELDQTMFDRNRIKEGVWLHKLEGQIVLCLREDRLLERDYWWKEGV